MKNSFEILKEAILAGELNYYRATSSYAYVAKYEDGKQEIVYSSLSAEEERPSIDFKIVASARWHENQGYPEWRIYSTENEDDFDIICTDYDGNVIDD